MPAATPAAPRLDRIHWLLAVQSVVVILLSINRLTPLSLGYVWPNEFLRWYDFNNMLVLPLVSVLASFVLIRHLETGEPGVPHAARWRMALNLVFLAGVYWLGASYGDHEVTNYLHTRFCIPGDGSVLCDIVIFNDDEFSHYVFFISFVMVNLAIMLLQLVFPYRGAVGPRDLALLVANGVFIGLGVFANLAFEEIGLDLYVVALLALLAVALLWRWGRQPLLVYYATAYVFGLIATGAYKLVSGGP